MLASVTVLALFQPTGPVSESYRPDRVVQVIPGHYKAGTLERFLWGDNWRDLWATPIRAPIVNLDTTRGGLTAYERGNSHQSISLRFKASDGRVYQFRSVDKVALQQWPKVVGWGPVLWAARSRMSGLFPTGALLVGELEKSAGLTPTERWLVILPESPRLGEWGELAGTLGLLERRYSVEEGKPPEIPGAFGIVSTKGLFERLEQDSTSRIEDRRYLTARLLDLLVGDWDRRDDQWSWIGVQRDGFLWWTAVPRDRDWALSHVEGLGNALLRLHLPIIMTFEPGYPPSIRGLVVAAEPLDRRLLTGLDRSAFRETAVGLRDRLSDEVLARAVESLPPEFNRARLAQVVQILKTRRDSLPAAADRFYERLATVVDIRASSGTDLVEMTRNDDGSVLIEMARAGKAVFQRRFVAAETDEIRIHLLAGADSVRIRGAANRKGIPVRIVTGRDDTVHDTTEGGSVRTYPDSTFDPPVEPVDPSRIHRDFGHRWSLTPWLDWKAELGVLVGAGPVLTTYGFRRVPFKARLALRVGTTTGRGGVNADIKWDFRFADPPNRVIIRAAALNRDMIHYFGLGNETARPVDRSFNHVVEKRYSLSPQVEVGVNRSGTARVQLGAVVQWFGPDETRPTLLLAQRPYGSGSFTEAGIVAGVVLDTRDLEELPTRGVLLTLQGRAVPALFDVETAFASVALEGATYLAAAKVPTIPTLALHAGAMKVLGSYPFFEAAAIGGRHSLRGVSSRRFVGDASVFGNAELRLNLGDAHFPFGGDWGVLGLVDVGRVWLEGETSDRWHSSLGGGLWVALLGKRHVLTATAAKSPDDKIRIYLHTGFHF